MLTVTESRADPESRWSKGCEVCDEPDVDFLCGGCRAGLHLRCGSTHRQRCSEMVGRLQPQSLTTPLDDLVEARTGLLMEDA